MSEPPGGPASTPGQCTERSNVPNALSSDSPSMFRLLFERSADAIWLYDARDQVFVDCNDAAVTLMRCGTRERLLRVRPAELSPARQPDGRSSEEATRTIAAIIAERGAHRFEWTARRFDGTEVPLEIVLTAVPSGDRPLHVVVSRDISERKEAEAALRQSEQLLGSIASNIQEAVYRTGPNHELVFVNEAYLRMFGYERTDEVQQIPRERLYARPESRQHLHASLARDGRFTAELEFVRQDGSRFWGRISSVAIRDDATGATRFHVGTISDVTERRAAEEKIRQLNATLEQRVAERTAELTRSEERLRTLIENAPEAIVVLDGASGRFVSANGNAARLFGLSRDELARMHPAELSPVIQPDGRLSIDASREHIQHAMSGEPIVFEWTHRRANGHLVPCEVRLVRLPGEGTPLIRGSIIDNTERRRREQVQQATFDILDSVHQSGDLPSLFGRIHRIIGGLMPAQNFYIALYDPGTQQISFPYYVEDDRFFDLAPRAIGSGLTGYVLRTGRPLLVDAAMNARKRTVGDAVTFEGYDQITYVEVGRPAAIWLGVPLAIEGRPIGVMAVQDYHDEKAYGGTEKQILTYVARQTALAIDRKRSEQALRESEQKFRALFEASSQGVMLHDEFHYLEVNPATARILGYDRPDQLIGKNPVATSPPVQPGGFATAELARQHVHDCLEHGSTRFDWVASRADGQDVPLEVILTRVQMGGRQIIQAVINDITDRKKAEAELLRALGREKELSQLKTDFVSMVSHEFRTPLGIIMSSAEILSDYFERLEPDERGHHLHSIVRHSARMSEMMEEVLVLGRLDSGRMEFKPGPIDLGNFFQKLVDEVEAATERRCPVRLHCDTLPAAGLGDERLLRHIVLNLLTNAVKYSDPGQPVDFSLEQQGPRCVARIQDRGIGIPPADQPGLFSAFHRGRNVGLRAGTGLGLVIVRRCVDLHQGSIRLESEPGRGTLVTLEVPMF